jgi:hypothetical protein
MFSLFIAVFALAAVSVHGLGSKMKRANFSSLTSDFTPDTIAQGAALLYHQSLEGATGNLQNLVDFAMSDAVQGLAARASENKHKRAARRSRTTAALPKLLAENPRVLNTPMGIRLLEKLSVDNKDQFKTAFKREQKRTDGKTEMQRRMGAHLQKRFLDIAGVDFSDNLGYDFAPDFDPEDETPRCSTYHYLRFWLFNSFSMISNGGPSSIGTGNLFTGCFFSPDIASCLPGGLSIGPTELMTPLGTAANIVSACTDGNTSPFCARTPLIEIRYIPVDNQQLLVTVTFKQDIITGTDGQSSDDSFFIFAGLSDCLVGDFDDFDFVDPILVPEDDDSHNREFGDDYDAFLFLGENIYFGFFDAEDGVGFSAGDVIAFLIPFRGEPDNIFPFANIFS